MMKKRLQILFIEDDDQMRRALVIIAKIVLDDIVLEAATARNGQEGLDICQRKFFDVIVTDLMMPIKNGWEFLEDFRRSNNETPVLALSAMPPDSTTPDISGFNDFLVKPFSNAAFKDFLLGQIVI